MNTPTYEQQFNKITEAYIKGDIKPMDRSFCFCGTLEDNDHKWINKNTCKNLTYSFGEYKKMEDALLNHLTQFSIFRTIDGCWMGNGCPELCDPIKYEPALFNGIVAALEVLKQIHIERGEIIDQPPVFTKRLTLHPIK